MYLGAKSFIETIKPKAPKNKVTTKDGKASVEDCDEDEEEAKEGLEDEDWLVDWVQLDEGPQEANDVVDFTAGDVLGKTLALVNQVCQPTSLSFLCVILIILRFVLRLRPSNTSLFSANRRKYLSLS